MVLCLLAADEEEAGDAALQIHFTLIQAFCCENDINILRVSNPARLAQLLLPAAGPEPPADLHCVLVTVSRGAGRRQRPGSWGGALVFRAPCVTQGDEDALAAL